MRKGWLGLGLCALALVACAEEHLLPCQPGAERKPGSDRCVPKDTGGTGGGGGTTTSSSSTSSSSTSTSSSGGGGCDPGSVLPGSFPIGPSDAVVPLCNAQVILGDKIKKTVEIRDVTTKGTVKSWQLAAPPGDIVYDAAANTAYVAEDGAKSLAQIDLSTTTVTEIALSSPAIRLALGDAGQVFATLQPISLSDVGVTLIEGGKAVDLTVPSQTSELIAYDPATHRLFTGDRGSSPSGLARYAFDYAAKTLTLEQERWDAGGNGQDLTLSPDGKHLVFPCGGGNGTGYTFFDFDVEDLDNNFGEWNTGPYPTAAAYAPEGKRLLVSNSTDLFVFDTSTYMPLNQDMPKACDYHQVERVAVSPGGRFFYVISKCGFDKDSGDLHWYVH